MVLRCDNRTSQPIYLIRDGSDGSLGGLWLVRKLKRAVDDPATRDETIRGEMARMAAGRPVKCALARGHGAEQVKWHGDPSRAGSHVR